MLSHCLMRAFDARVLHSYTPAGKSKGGEAYEWDEDAFYDRTATRAKVQTFRKRSGGCGCLGCGCLAHIQLLHSACILPVCLYLAGSNSCSLCCQHALTLPAVNSPAFSAPLNLPSNFFASPQTLRSRSRLARLSALVDAMQALLSQLAPVLSWIGA